MQVVSAGEDLIGNAIVSKGEPDYHSVQAAVPMMLDGWGQNARFGYNGQHTFTTSRLAGVDVVLDSNGDAGDWSGYPRSDVSLVVWGCDEACLIVFASVGMFYI